MLRDCLAGFDRLRLTVTGDCMRPALHPGDTVVLAPVRTAPPRFGDVVLLRHPGGPAAAPADLAPARPALAHQGRPRGLLRPGARARRPARDRVAADPPRGAVRSAWRALRSLAAAVGARLHLRSAW